MTEWTNVKEFKKDGYLISVSYLSQTDNNDIKNADLGIKQEFKIKVSALLAGQEMGNEILGPLYVANGTPKTYIEDLTEKFLNFITNKALDKAKKNAAMLELSDEGKEDKVVVKLADAVVFERLHEIVAELTLLSKNAKTDSAAQVAVNSSITMLRDILESEELAEKAVEKEEDFDEVLDGIEDELEDGDDGGFDTKIKII